MLAAQQSGKTELEAEGWCHFENKEVARFGFMCAILRRWSRNYTEELTMHVLRRDNTEVNEIHRLPDFHNLQDLHKYGRV